MVNIISGIYKIECNGHVYIGQSVNIKERWRQHRKGWIRCQKDKKRRPVNRFLQNVFNKYGMKNMIFTILLEIDKNIVNKIGYVATKNMLKPLEQTYMTIYNPDMNLYEASGSPAGYKHTEEFKENKRRARLGQKHLDETKEAIRQAHLGKKKSPESIAKTALGLSNDFSIYHRYNGWINGKNITEYARKNNLSRSSLSNVISGKCEHYDEIFFKDKEHCENFLANYKYPSSVHRGVGKVKGRDTGKFWKSIVKTKKYGNTLAYHYTELEAAEWAVIARQVYDVS